MRATIHSAAQARCYAASAVALLPADTSPAENTPADMPQFQSQPPPPMPQTLSQQVRERPATHHRRSAAFGKSPETRTAETIAPRCLRLQQCRCNSRQDRKQQEQHHQHRHRRPCNSSEMLRNSRSPITASSEPCNASTNTPQTARRRATATDGPPGSGQQIRRIGGDRKHQRRKNIGVEQRTPR